MSTIDAGAIVSVDFGMELIAVSDSLKWGMKSWKDNWDDNAWYLIDIQFRLAGVQETLYIREKSRNAVFLTERLVLLLTDEDERLKTFEEHHDKYYQEARTVGPYNVVRNYRQSVVHGGTPGGAFIATEDPAS